MKIVARVAYGERGQGSLIRYEGVATWFSVYCQRGAERRRTTGETEFKAARKAHRGFLDALAAERQGHTALPSPLAARMTVSALLDELEADFRLRGLRWLKQARYHAAPIRAWFGDVGASKLTAAGVDRYIEAKLAEDYTPASVNRQTGLLAQALRLAHRRGTPASVLAVRRLPERNARQGFLEHADLDQVVAALPEYLRDLVRFAYLTAWRRGELVSLHWSDVDRDGGVIRLRPEHSKNGCGRTVAIEGDLCAIIERRWQAPGQERGRHGAGRRARVPSRGAPDCRLPQGVGPGVHRRRAVPRGGASTRTAPSGRSPPGCSTTSAAAACATWCAPASRSGWRWRSPAIARARSSIATTS
jgi:integrase